MENIAAHPLSATENRPLNRVGNWIWFTIEKENRKVIKLWDLSQEDSQCCMTFPYRLVFLGWCKCRCCTPSATCLRPCTRRCSHTPCNTQLLTPFVMVHKEETTERSIKDNQRTVKYGNWYQEKIRIFFSIYLCNFLSDFLSLTDAKS